jgi:ribosome-associated protein
LESLSEHLRPCGTILEILTKAQRPKQPRFSSELAFLHMNIDDRLQDEESDDIYEGPSKSQKKREAEALQKLGGELAKLAPDAFERVTGLPEDIRDAILEYRRLKSFGALRRQMQLIGKLMRRLDYDAVREAIDRATGASRAAAAAHQRAEKLRDALLSDNDKLTEYVSSHPEVDVQQLRTLIRLARKEKEAAKPPKYFRELYRFLHAAELPALTLEKADDEEVA